jgi:hypothetical protein
VRALDIRCGSEWSYIYNLDPKYNVFHGGYDQQISIAEVMDTVAGFLKDHPKEVVLVFLKQEHAKDNISAEVNKIVNKALGKALYERQDGADRWPRLGECRGKALVLSRLANPSAEHFSTLGWAGDQKSLSVDCGQWEEKNYGYGTIIQDLWNRPSTQDKKDAVEASLLAARAAAKKDNETQLYLNFTSFTWLMRDPVTVGAEVMTPWLLTRQRGTGVVCVDAVTEELATHILKLNF